MTSELVSLIPPDQATNGIRVFTEEFVLQRQGDLIELLVVAWFSRRREKHDFWMWKINNT